MIVGQGTPKYELPTTEQEARERRRRNHDRDAAMLGQPSPRGPVLHRGGEVEVDPRERVPHDRVFDDFDSWCRGLEVAAEAEDGLSRGGGGVGTKPCELLLEIKELLRRVLATNSVPSEYSQYLP